MTDDFELRAISPSAVPEALAKAERYRLLNQSDEAESICRDILDVDPGYQPALAMLVLALSDQFGHQDSKANLREASQIAAKLEDNYERLYYGGIARERAARAMLGGLGRSFAYDGFREAMEWYEEALPIRPAGDDNAILRWNSCVRSIRTHNLRPRVEEGELPLE
jgi:tetratricopeptide (TPR) repeat protein